MRLLRQNAPGTILVRSFLNSRAARAKLQRSRDSSEGFDAMNGFYHASQRLCQGFPPITDQFIEFSADSWPIFCDNRQVWTLELSRFVAIMME